MVGVAVLLTYSPRRPLLRNGARVVKNIAADRDEYALPNETDCFLATLLVLALLGQTLLERLFGRWTWA